MKFNGRCLFLDYVNNMARAEVQKQVERQENEIKLETILGKELADHILEIIMEQDEDKQDAFLETTIEAAMAGLIIHGARPWMTWRTYTHGG